MTQDTIAVIRTKLTEALAPARLDIVDESHLHAGHAAARGGGGHYAVTIVSTRFQGLPTLARHRLVYKALEGEMKRTIHALALSTLTPEESGAGSKGTGRVSTLR